MGDIITSVYINNFNNALIPHDSFYLKPFIMYSLDIVNLMQKKKNSILYDGFTYK